MKTQLLIVSLILCSSCQHRVEDNIKIDTYDFLSLYELGKEIKVQDGVDVIANIKKSKKIKGPIIGIDVKVLKLVNKVGDRDTFEVIIYGKDNRYFRIGEEFM